jgi:formylglycine-generating enzyme required for sulfatase activity
MKSMLRVLVSVLSIGLIGCDDDDVAGGTAPVTAGRIVISPRPEGIDAPWEVAGPDGYSAEGRGWHELLDRVPGDYAIAWGDLSRFGTPPGEARYLAAGRTTTFTGVYTEDEFPAPPPGFVYIPPGTFMMGSPGGAPGAFAEELPQHRVTLTLGFYMARFEVTEQWWCEVMGGTPTTSRLPKSQVSWDLAVRFCNALSDRDGLTPAYTIHDVDGDVTWNRGADGYRLPTEAEWEYACRATTTASFHNDTDSLSSAAEANFDGQERVAVGSYPANLWGLHDMHGNLWEWVWCGLRTYSSSPQVDPVHDVAPRVTRGLRGGSWNHGARFCRSAFRFDGNPDDAHSLNGLRPVRSAF